MHQGFRLFADDRAPTPANDETNREPAEITSALALALYRLRRRRERLFSTGLFSEPSWDLLLDLLAAEKTGKRVCITSACIAAVAPTTTALRCLKQMEREGLVYREADSSDGRRIYIRLSEETIANMDELFTDLGQNIKINNANNIEKLPVRMEVVS